MTSFFISGCLHKKGMLYLHIKMLITAAWDFVDRCGKPEHNRVQGYYTFLLEDPTWIVYPKRRDFPQPLISHVLKKHVFFFFLVNENIGLYNGLLKCYLESGPRNLIPFSIKCSSSTKIHTLSVLHAFLISTLI